MERIEYIARHPEPLNVTGTPPGYDAFLAARAAEISRSVVLFITLDDVHAEQAEHAIRFFAPGVDVCLFPAWDCLPYDRVSPKPDIVSTRLSTLAALARRKNTDAPMVVVTTLNAATQRVIPRAALMAASFSARIGNVINHDKLTYFLAGNGYVRTGTVREPGDFAVRGGIVDIWAPGSEPIRLDFFGERLDAVRVFDAETQLTRGTQKSFELLPASEVPLDPESVRRFRTGYVAAFGPAGDDPLYESISAGRKAPGMEHWLPLFYDGMESLFDYLPAGHPGCPVFLAHQLEPARRAREELVADYYDTRLQFLKTKNTNPVKAPVYKPVKPGTLYLSEEEWGAAMAGLRVRELSPFTAPDVKGSVDAGARLMRDFAPERKAGENVFSAAAEHVKSLQKNGCRVLVAAWTEGSSERLGAMLSDNGLTALKSVQDAKAAEKLNQKAAALVVLGLEHGFETADFAVLAEQDMLGERMARPHRRPKRAQNFLTEASALAAGDIVTHIDHGVGRYIGLKTLDVSGAPHDCLELHYDGGKLFLPVENIELLSRYGSADENVALDKLGAGGWQMRKARAKERVREIAGELIRIAAARELRHLPPTDVPSGLYDEFCARFPYTETEDQDHAIADAIEDLAKGRPMDRLVCGDVGFGKTEVALRVAFVAAMAGYQVAVVVPTTLLARQHAQQFIARFEGFPVRVRQLSRFVDAKEARETKAGLASGDVNIVVGTHALLAKSISFNNLGLVIVDEEQHFGVNHKERLKSLKADVHVLTLTATPIPRTLQLALSGVRDLSLITTPPVDRLAVRTYVSPFDPLVIREAILREHYRGGQSFYVAPRITDLDEAMDFLRDNVPEVKPVLAHGKMSATQLEDVMTAFYERKVDVLVSTNIVESGLDIPAANTLIVHRADRFGLSQLYQLRGRIGRGKQRGYAYLTTPAGQKLTETAERRLAVLQSLDQLGAGFSVASHDMDIRGAGNLLGEEQSGHVREVGVELYQEMLEEAVANLRAGGAETEIADQWSPNISIGAAVLIPENYVPDLNVRMSLYRRLSTIETRADIDAFAAELIDRFGPCPEEVQHLFEIVEIKQLCRAANVEKIDAGPKGGLFAFRHDTFANPVGLVGLIARHGRSVKVRPDQKLVVVRQWDTPEERLKGVKAVMTQLAKLAAA